MCTPTVTSTNKQTDKGDRGSDTNVSTDRASEEEDGSNISRGTRMAPQG